MWRRLYTRKGQSTGEYALVFAIILGAVIAMQTYVRRGVQGRVKSGTDYMARATGEQVGVDGTAFDAGGIVTQYDPYYYSSDYTTAREADETQEYTDGEVFRNITKDDAARASGGYTEFQRAQWQDIEHLP